MLFESCGITAAGGKFGSEESRSRGESSYDSCGSIEIARRILSQRFGYSGFRPVQERAVQAVLSGRDALIVLPTGGGKSICYQVPALARPGLSVVVSPLISLMNDQVGALMRRGISAACLNSTISQSENASCMSRIRDGSLKLLYLAPERLENTRLLGELARGTVALLAIDEAHCIAEWGHDFRPGYLRIGRMRESLGAPQTVALTATATPSVRSEVVRQLSLRNPVYVTGGFDRINLSYHVQHTRRQGEKDLATVRLVRSVDSPAIVYASTRKSVDRLTTLLNRYRVRATGYHGGMDDTLRQRSQDAFMGGRSRVIVATNAFGMGIDKPDVRLVVHHGMPGSLEAYYQEAGRAGRDGLPGTCVLLYSPADRHTHEYFIAHSYPPRSSLEATWRVMKQQAEASGNQVVSIASLRSFLRGKVDAAHVESSARILTEMGLCTAEAPDRKIWIRLTARPERIERTFGIDHPERRFLDHLARRHSAARTSCGFTCSIEDLASCADDYTRVDQMLEKLESQQFLVCKRSAGGLRIAQDSRSSSGLRLNLRSLEHRRVSELSRLDAMQRYAKTRQCRRAYVLRYFGESDVSPICSGCDRCLGSTGVLPFVG